MHVDLEFNTSVFLLGIDYSDCVVEDMDSGSIYDCNSLSFGFLFFTIHFHFNIKKRM